MKRPQSPNLNWRPYLFGGLFLGLILFLFFGLGDLIFLKDSSVGLLVFVIIFGGIPVSGWFFLKALNKDWYRLAPLSILILGPLFGLWSRQVSEDDLEKYNTTTRGIVIGTKACTVGRWGSSPCIKAQFVYAGKKYQTFWKTIHSDEHISVGDAVSIRFSSRNPENNELVIE